MRLRLYSAIGLALLFSCGPLAAGCDSDEHGPVEPRATGLRCEGGAVRESPAAPSGQAIVLGCGRTRAGTRFQLYSFRDAGGPCLNIVGLPGGTRACGRAPSERVPATTKAIGGGVIVRKSPHARLELYGETASNVRRVLLRYRLSHGRPDHRPATLVRVIDRTALDKARISEPFGYFVGAVPPRAAGVSALALDGAGEPLGRLGFDRLAGGTHPNTVFIASKD